MLIFHPSSLGISERVIFPNLDSIVFLCNLRLNFLFVLVGNVVNIQTGHWVGKQSGLGAGSDSFYEYLLKSYILFGEKEDLEMFNAAYQNIQNHLRRGYVIHVSSSSLSSESSCKIRNTAVDSPLCHALGNLFFLL